MRFHVLQDNGSSLLILTQRNVLKGIKWYDSTSNNNSYGPIGTNGILTKLESLTTGWSNVNTLVYSIGSSSSTLGYSR